jgi:hypothetical protein
MSMANFPVLRLRILGLALCALTPTVALGQALNAPFLRAGTSIPLVTAVELSTKTEATGNHVPMRTAEDVLVDGKIAIPKGTEATGLIESMRKKGAMGQRGQMTLRPLFLTLRGQTIRLSGKIASAGKADTGAVIGIALLTPGFTGRSAIIPAGTPVAGAVMRDVTLAP